MNHESFDNSFKMYMDQNEPLEDVEMGPTGPNPSPCGLDLFSQEVDNVKEDMKDLEKLYNRVVESNEDVKIAQNAMAMRELRDEMNADLDHIQKLAKLINKKYDGLVRANAAQRRVTGSGPGSLDDNSRAAMISELGEGINHLMRKFQALRVQMETDHRQLIESRYFSITREKATAEAIDNLIASEAPESPLHHAMQDHGRGPVLDAVAEIQERRGAMTEIRRSLMALHQILLGIASPVAAAAAAEGGQVGASRGGGPPSPDERIPSPPPAAAAAAAAGPPVTVMKAGGLNDYERETRNQAYIAIAVALVIIFAIIVMLLNFESRIENGEGDNP